jgi:hypothetical protein
LWWRPDRANFDQIETERLDLPEDAEQRGPILKESGKHGLTFLKRRCQRGKGREGGWSEPAFDPDGVQAGRFNHALILPPHVVSLRRRNLVIVRPWGLALLPQPVRASGREQSQLARTFHSGGAITHVKLVVEVAHMRIYRVHGHEELPGDLAPRHIRRHVAQHAQLGRAELYRRRWGLPTGPRGRRSFQHVDDVGQKGAVRRLVTRQQVEQLGGLGQRKGENQPVWFCGRECRLGCRYGGIPIRQL